MNLKATTWILVAALAAIIAYFFLVDERSRVRSVMTNNISARLFPYGSDEVAGFVLLNAQGERIDVERAGGGWRIVRPVETPGARPEISSFVDQIVPGHRSSEITNVGSYADYGLEKPYATLILRRAGAAEPDTLFIGDETPVGSNCYLRLGGSPTVYVANKLARTLARKDLFQFRDKNFLPEDTRSAREVEIRAGAKRIRLLKDRDAWWLMPERARANRAAIEPYLARLADAVIHEFVREDASVLAPYGLDPPAGELVLRKGDETITVAFGTVKEYLVHAARTGLDKVVAIEATLREPLEWRSDDLRARNLAYIDEAELHTLRCETPDTILVIERDGASWRARGRGLPAIPAHEVSTLLQKLNSTEFERILKAPLPADGSFERFAFRMTAADARGGVIDRITVVRQPDGSEAGYSTSANALGSLPPGTASGIEALVKRIGEP